MNATLTLVMLAVGPVVMMVPVLLLMIFARDRRTATQA
jgi:hypothetical protein